MASTNAARKQKRNSAKLGTAAIRDSKPTKQQLERRSKIVSLAKSALANAADTKSRARLSVEQAIECGKLLIQEKMSLKEQGIKGKWLEYFGIIFGKSLPYPTASGWMRLAANHKNLPLENITRKGMLALELFPAKVHEKHNVKSNEPFISATHIIIINRFIVWRRKFGEKILANSLTEPELNQLRQDFAPVILFVDQLKAGTLIEAAQPIPA